MSLVKSGLRALSDAHDFELVLDAHKIELVLDARKVERCS